MIRIQHDSPIEWVTSAVYIESSKKVWIKISFKCIMIWVISPSLARGPSWAWPWQSEAGLLMGHLSSRQGLSPPTLPRHWHCHVLLGLIDLNLLQGARDPWEGGAHLVLSFLALGHTRARVSLLFNCWCCRHYLSNWYEFNKKWKI